MTAGIEWTAPAFARLEPLPKALAFDVIRRVDALAVCPEMGSPITGKDRALWKCRQLIVRRSRRVYEYDEAPGVVYVLAEQHCRQRLWRGGILNVSAPGRGQARGRKHESERVKARPKGRMNSHRVTGIKGCAASAAVIAALGLTDFADSALSGEENPG